ncbi:MAG: hypothetical protein BWY28_00997 [bacterium ADurb.Bin236]|nr:MAG: hypothetical protein BWY28_00997 [bacterium ADurb.Bin236]
MAGGQLFIFLRMDAKPPIITGIERGNVEDKSGWRKAT